MTFQKGHPPYYTGGSVPGHAPTNTKPTMYPGHPNWKLGDYEFGRTPLGEENRKKGGNRPKDKERRCLEELQSGQDRDNILERRYPKRMIARLRALLDVSENPDHKDFINAQRMIREILGKHRGIHHDDRPTGERGSIELIDGHVDVPLPGSGAAPVGEGPAGSEGEARQSGGVTSSDGASPGPSLPENAGGGVVPPASR